MVSGLAMLMLPGCGLLNGGNYLDRERACDHNPHDWWGSLTRYVDQGNGEGGFDLNPPAEQFISRIQGKYDLDSGDFSFSREYIEAHYYVQEIGTGYGIVDRNGDLDVIYKLEHRDDLGDSWTTEIHEVREGCRGTTTELFSDVEGDEAIEEYRFVADDQVNIHRVVSQGEGQEVTDGSDFADGTGERLRTYEGDDYEYEYDTQIRAAGGYSSEWVYEDHSRDRVYRGDDVGRVDGSREQDYTLYDEDNESLATWHEERQYDGSGEATLTDASGVTCDYEYQDWYSCSCECSNGTSCNC